MKTSDAVAMSVDDALRYADSIPDIGSGAVSKVLAAEVRRLRDHIPDGTEMVEPANKQLLLKILEALHEECAGKCNAEYNPCWARQLIGEIELELSLTYVALDAEARALALDICAHVLSHTHPWAYIDEAKKLKKLLGAE